MCTVPEYLHTLDDLHCCVYFLLKYLFPMLERRFEYHLGLKLFPLVCGKPLTRFGKTVWNWRCTSMAGQMNMTHCTDPYVTHLDQKWLVTINARKKATYTIFSLATKEQKAHLQVNAHELPQDTTPTYLGITFDPRMTWKQQINKYTTRARLWTALMKKLPETSWGADHRIQKKNILDKQDQSLSMG